MNGSDRKGHPTSTPTTLGEQPGERAHVVVISGQGPPSMDGVGDATAMLVAALARAQPGWRWTWMYRRPGWWRSPIVPRNGYTVVRPNHTWNAAGRRAACRMLRALRPDLVHIQDQIHSYFETDAAVLLADATPAPVVTTLHEYHVELPSVVHTDELVRRSVAIVANDARNAARCLERTGRAADARWWSGSTVEPPRPGEFPPPERDVVTTFGFISALKALELPLGALDRLRGEGRSLRWRILGPFRPDRNHDHARLASLAGEGRAEFTGAVSFPELRRLLAASRIMLLPFADSASLRRMTLHAAWAFGIPTITTPPTHDEPAIVDGENCLLVREATPDAWAAAIGRILDDPALEARLSEGSRRAADLYGWPELSRRHLELYDRILSELAVGRPL
jgi:glycosyltransferase involved in cell wall biosynthesis